MRKKIFVVYLSILLSLFTQIAVAQKNVVFSNPDENIQISEYVLVLEDTAGTMSAEEVLHSQRFFKPKQEVPNLEMSESTFWVKFQLTNASQNDRVVLEYPYPTIDSVELFEILPNGQSVASISKTGEYRPVESRRFKHQNYIFNVNLLPGQTKTYLMRLNASEQIQIPLTLGSDKSIAEGLQTKDFIFGLYAGLILVMFFYNLFIFFTVRDSTYLYYVIYILFVGLTQACVQGYAARFFYPNSAPMANFMMVFAPAMVGVTALEFLKKFMKVKEYTPTLYKLIHVVIGVYMVIILLGVFKQYQLAAQVVQMNAMAGSILVLIIGVKIVNKGYSPAKFFLIAWSVFLVSVIIFVLRNFGFLLYNNFTYYALQIGSALEIVLLSFALADKINILRKEKEESQAQAMAALEENSKIIREQNVVLENRVAERTQELTLSNEELNKTLKELKEAEMQLVESEKMASLGQLTAGIAHEINNPINFVTSNVKPLKRDVEMILTMLQEVETIGSSDDDLATKKKRINELKEEYDFDYLKTEIDYLLKGITEGSTRTAEIVKGLRIFSRLDEDDLKKASVNEGLESTLIIINNLLDNKIEVVRNYGNIPMVECYPGKLNQVFLNIITNGIHALKSKYKDQHGGIITITTTHTESTVSISIKDNGTGMDENTKKKLFEPFFTTKDVGEGTGLGLSIAYNTIKKHNGTIDVVSELGEGTEFIIEIPINQ